MLKKKNLDPEKEAELQRLYQEWEEASTSLIEMEK